MQKKKVLIITEFGCLVYDSIDSAAKQTGISRTRISRALNHSDNGCIPNTNPSVCVDLVEESFSDNRTMLPSQECLSCPYVKGVASCL